MRQGLTWTLRWLTAMGVLPKVAVAQLDASGAPSAQAVLDAGRLAENTYAVLDAIGHDVALIARAGQNLDQFGLRYSHLGFAVRDLRRGEWGVVHLLNGNDGQRSGIYEEGMVNFYSDNPYRMEAIVLALPHDLQQRLARVLKKHGRRMHCPRYSLTSYPWSLSTQNSNQWILEVLALAASENEEACRQEVHVWLQSNGYTPAELHIGLPTQWAAPLLRDCIRFDDQPDETRRQGAVSVVTVESVLSWLQGPDSPLHSARLQIRTFELRL